MGTYVPSSMGLQDPAHVALGGVFKTLQAEARSKSEKNVRALAEMARAGAAARARSY